MKTSHIFLLLFLPVLWLLPEGCAPALVKPELDLKEISLVGMSFTSMTLGFKVKVQNPNPVGTTLESLSYHLKLNGIEIGTGTLAGAVSLPANGSAEVVLPFTASFSGMTQSVQLLLGQENASYELSGNAVLSILLMKKEFPFQSSGTVPINRSGFHH
ncbi:MAG TPA: LEA type 2 family protein [Nitrospiria bacterium]|nr:LEA type 2 family protein [Nitrospiria bacterium]